MINVRLILIGDQAKAENGTPVQHQVEASS